MKTSRHPKQAALAALAAGLVVVVVAGTAFACTEFRGNVTMTGVGGTSGSATYQGDGGEDLAGYCTTPTRQAFTTAAPATALTFKLDVERTSCGTAGALVDGVYEVRWIQTSDAVVLEPATECHFNTDPTNLDLTPAYTVLGEMTMAAGSATGVFDLITSPVAPTVGPGNICVQLMTPVNPGSPPATLPGHDTGPQNWAPPTIFMKWTTV